MRVGKIVVAGVAAEAGHQGDADVLKEALDLEGVAADVIFPQQVDLELAFLDGVVQPHHVGEDAVVGDVVAGGLTHAFVALATEAEDVESPSFSFISRATAWTSSPMRPTGQVEKMPMALGLKRS